MAFTSPTDDIIIQEGTFAFGYTCSGTVSAGQAVEAIGTMQARAVPITSYIADGCIGVAAYDQTNGNMLGVYGPGNICRVIISGTSKCTVGDSLIATNEGKWIKSTATGYLASGVIAIALETQATANGTARVMLH